MSDNLLDSRSMTLLEFRLFRDLIYEHWWIFYLKTWRFY